MAHDDPMSPETRAARKAAYEATIAANRARTLPLYRVSADGETGEWLDDLELIGEINAGAHSDRQDTDEVHFDCFERDGRTCAVEVHWVR